MEIESTQSAPLTDTEEDQAVSPDSRPETEQENAGVNEDSQPSTDEKNESEPSADPTESAVEAMKKALDEDPETAAKEPEAKEGDTEAKAKTEPDKDSQPGEQGKKPEPPDGEIYEMPEGLKPKSQERFQTLVSRAKELEQENTEVNTQLQGMREIVSQSGTNKEQFMTLMDYSALVNSGDPAKLKQALEIIEGQRKAISEVLGVESPGVDLLEGFDDLQAKVDQMEITRELANEIASARRTSSRQDEFQRNQQVEQETASVATQERTQAISQIDQMVSQWKKTDIDFSAKEKIIADSIIRLAQSGSVFSPSQWPLLISEKYNDLSRAGSLAKPKQQPHTQPLRANGSQGGKAPMGDVISQMREAVDGVYAG